MKTGDIKRANDLLENYEKAKKEIIRASCLNYVTLFYLGHSSHDMRGEDVAGIKITLIRGFETHAHSLLGQLVNEGVDIDHERDFLDNLVTRALREAIQDDAYPR